MAETKVDEYGWAKSVMAVTTARRNHPRININQSDMMRNLEGEQGKKIERIKRAIKAGKGFAKLREYGNVVSILRPAVHSFLISLGGRAAEGTRDWLEWSKQRVSHEAEAHKSLKVLMSLCTTSEQECVVSHIYKLIDALKKPSQKETVSVDEETTVKT